MATRQALLEKHDNDYGFNVRDTLDVPLINHANPSSISVVIPYFETGEIFKRSLHFLDNAAAKYPGKIDIIIVDDGSKTRPLVDNLIEIHHAKLVPIILASNVGRTEARNAGLKHAKGDICFFLDSDILVDQDIFLNHAKLQTQALEHNHRAICVSFFEFTDSRNEKINYAELLPTDIASNDFRLECTYGPTWIGCEADKAFIGQRMELVAETNDFRDWKGQYKAWMLPNMILGGAFSVQKSEIDAINGFDPRFQGYGFTETSAVTRMVAERNNVVIPCTVGGALHIEDTEINETRENKDKIFREKHDFYFDVFLQEEGI